VTPSAINLTTAIRELDGTRSTAAHFDRTVGISRKADKLMSNQYRRIELIKGDVRCRRWITERKLQPHEGRLGRYGPPDHRRTVRGDGAGRLRASAGGTLFEYAEWKSAKVHPDYQVEIDKTFYRCHTG